MTLVVSFVLATHAPVLGQGPDEVAPSSSPTESSEPAARREARRHFGRGLELAREQQWSRALSEFLASRQFYPTRAATRNAAVASRELGRYSEACALYRAVLREFGPDMTTVQLDVLRLELAQAERSLAKIALSGVEPGARVSIDGEERGETPLAEPLAVNPGGHLLHVSKPGFQPVELSLIVASGDLKRIDARLTRVVPTGDLFVSEERGRHLDVVVDGVMVGVTPWRGSVAPGAHSVLLRGPAHLGTAPSAVQVRATQSQRLVLRAGTLDSSVRIESNEPEATVFVDGVAVGYGAWQGRLPSGAHRVDVVAKDSRAFGAVIQLGPGRPALVHAELKHVAPRPSFWEERVYLQARAGALFAASFNGSADESCGCSPRARPKGGFASLHAGYSLLPGLGLELGVGYLSLAERLTRQISGERDGRDSLTSGDYRDSTRLSGPFLGVDVSYRVSKRTPLTARLGMGVAFLGSATSGSGTFQGDLTNRSLPGERVSYAGRIDGNELDRLLVTTFATTELRFGVRVTRRLVIDLGLAATLFLPPEKTREGTTDYSERDTRTTVLPSSGATWSDGAAINAGVLTLPRERVAGPFVAYSPSVGARFDF